MTGSKLSIAFIDIQRYFILVNEYSTGFVIKKLQMLFRKENNVL